MRASLQIIAKFRLPPFPSPFFDDVSDVIDVLAFASLDSFPSPWLSRSRKD